MAPQSSSSSSSKQKGKASLSLPSLSTFLLVLMASAMSFMAGTFQAFHAGMNHCQTTGEMANQVRQDAFKDLKPQPPQQQQQPQQSSSSLRSLVTEEHSSGNNNQLSLPKSISRFAAGMAHTSKANLTRKLNLGVPLDLPEPGTEDVLILYNQEKAKPQYAKNAKNAAEIIPYIASADDALQNCEYLNVVLTHHEPNRRQCVAMVPQYESFHIQRYMRLPKEQEKQEQGDKQKQKQQGGIDLRHELRLVPRGMQPNGFATFQPPKPAHTLNSWNLLKDYMTHLDDVLAELRPIAEKIATQEDNTIIVMVVNHGQSELMLNFACNARSRGLDTSNVLVFATDQESKELAESVGLATYFDHRVSAFHGVHALLLLLL